MTYRCPYGCEESATKKTGHPGRCSKHGELYVYTKPLKRSELNRVSEEAAPKARKRGSTLNRGRGFSVTEAQREKVRGLPCLNCGREASEHVAVDPAHLWPRGMGGCDDPLCVVPLCRHFLGGCHQSYDNGKLDILSKLIDRGYYAEMGHVISEHQVSPLTLLKRVTASEWEPVGSGVAA